MISKQILFIWWKQVEKYDAQLEDEFHPMKDCGKKRTKKMNKISKLVVVWETRRKWSVSREMNGKEGEKDGKRTKNS